MNKEDFEERMRALEYFHGLRALPGAWVVIRVDGRGFSRFTEARFEKPFDPAFHELMQQTAKTLFEELQGIYAYTESDEISLNSMDRHASADSACSCLACLHMPGSFLSQIQPV